MSEPEKNLLTCDTEKCRNFMREVDELSKAVAHKFDDTNNLIKYGSYSKWTEEKKIRFYELWEAFLLTHRKVWLTNYDQRFLDCNSTLPGPCQKVNGEVAGQREQALAYEKKLEKMTGEKESTIIVDKEKSVTPEYSLPTFKLTSGQKAFGFLALGLGLAYMLKKR